MDTRPDAGGGVTVRWNEDLAITRMTTWTPEYFAAAMQAALILAADPGAVPGPPTPVNVWWDCFDRR